METKSIWVDKFGGKIHNPWQYSDSKALKCCLFKVLWKILIFWNFQGNIKNVLSRKLKRVKQSYTEAGFAASGISLTSSKKTPYHGS